MNPLRIAMVFETDPDDAAAVSGMPHAARRALERAGCEVVPLRIDTTDRAPKGPLREAWRRLLPKPFRRAVFRSLYLRGNLVEEGSQRAASSISAWIDAERARLGGRDPVDAIFGMCVSVPIAHVDPSISIPVVYTSDATARIVFSTYPEHGRMREDYRRSAEECERRALHRADAVGLAAEASIESAVRDYGVPREKITLLPLGCHVMPDRNALPPIDPPTRAAVRLLVVASDPERKRTALCVAAVKELRRRGIGATLVHIGRTDPSLDSPFVESLGALRLSSSEDRARHLEAVRTSHLSILPSIGEAFGIAPAESALMGRPAIVSDAGGLPTVVRHGETGLVVPVSAGPGAWADAVESIVDDPTSYRRLGEAARERAWREFTWDAWALTMIDMVRTVGLRRARRRATAETARPVAVEALGDRAAVR